MSDASTIQVGAASFTPTAPASPTIRFELIQAIGATPDGAITLRTAAALVAHCWPSSDRRRPSRRYVGSVSDFGAFVADDLLNAGVTVQQIMIAGVRCAEVVLAAGVPGLTRDEARAATRPTEAPPGA